MDRGDVRQGAYHYNVMDAVITRVVAEGVIRGFPFEELGISIEPQQDSPSGLAATVSVLDMGRRAKPSQTIRSIMNQLPSYDVIYVTSQSKYYLFRK